MANENLLDFPPSSRLPPDPAPIRPAELLPSHEFDATLLAAYADWSLSRGELA